MLSIGNSQVAFGKSPRYYNILTGKTSNSPCLPKSKEITDSAAKKLQEQQRKSMRNNENLRRNGSINPLS